MVKQCVDFQNNWDCVSHEKFILEKSDFKNEYIFMYG